MMKTFDKEELTVGEFCYHGNFGPVYEGEYRGQKVAVELASDFGDNHKEEEAFRKEVSLWGELDHPNVAKFIGAEKLLRRKENQEGETKYWYIVSEFLEGGMLSKYLHDNRKKRLPLKRLIELGLDAARGLAYLHSQKIVHRDVKTRNMELDGDGRVKLVDFQLSAKEASEKMTEKVGTGFYMAPEVRLSEPYDHKCDVFSFGICLWEMFHCRPVEITTPEDVRPKVSGECPDKLLDLMYQCWLNKEGRPEMAHVVKTLEEIMEGILEEEAKRVKYFKGCFSLFKRS